MGNWTYVGQVLVLVLFGFMVPIGTPLIIAAIAGEKRMSLPKIVWALAAYVITTSVGASVITVALTTYSDKDGVLAGFTSVGAMAFTSSTVFMLVHLFED